VKKFGVTFPVAVDSADVFGSAFGLKAIPVSFLIDEVGIVRLRGGGPEKGFLDQIASILKEPLSEVRGRAPELPAARSTEQLEQAVAESGGAWKSRLALAERYAESGRGRQAIALFEEVARVRPDDSRLLFTWGLVLLRAGEKEAALVKLKAARDRDPENWRIRKQIWAIENPDKFYGSDSPDYGWQREELKREGR